MSGHHSDIILRDVRAAYSRLADGESDELLIAALQELCTMLCVGGEGFVRTLNCASYAAELVALMDAVFSPDVRTLAARGIAILVDTVPKACETVVSAGGVQLLAAAAADVIYLLQHEPFAEEVLKCTLHISAEAHASLLEYNMVQLLMSLLPLLPEHQRLVVLSCLSNIFAAVHEDNWETLRPSVVMLISVFTGRVDILLRPLESSDATPLQHSGAQVVGASPVTQARRDNEETTALKLLQCLAHIADRLVTLHAAPCKALTGLNDAKASDSAENPILDDMINVFENVHPALCRLLVCAPRLRSPVFVRNACFTILTSLIVVVPEAVWRAMCDHRISEMLVTATLNALSSDAQPLVSSHNHGNVDGVFGSDAATAAGGNAPASGQQQYVCGFLELFLVLLPPAKLTVDEFDVVTPLHQWSWGDEFHNKNDYEELVCRRIETEYQRQRRNAPFSEFELQHGSRSYGISFEHMRHVGRDGTLTRPLYRNPVLMGFRHRRAHVVLQLCSCPSQGGDASDSDERAPSAAAPRRRDDSRSASSQRSRNRASQRRVRGGVEGVPQGQAEDTDEEQDSRCSLFSCCAPVKCFFGSKNARRTSSLTTPPRGGRSQDATNAHEQVHVHSRHVARSSEFVSELSAIRLRNAEDESIHHHPHTPPTASTIAATATAPQRLFAELRNRGTDEALDDAFSSEYTSCVSLSDPFDHLFVSATVRRQFYSLAMSSPFLERLVSALVPCVLSVLTSSVNVLITRHAAVLALRCLSVVAFAPKQQFTSSTSLVDLVAPYATGLADAISNVLRASVRDIANSLCVGLPPHTRDGERMFGYASTPSGLPINGTGSLTANALTLQGELYCCACSAVTLMCGLFGSDKGVRNGFRDHRVLDLINGAVEDMILAVETLTRQATILGEEQRRCPCHSSRLYMLEEALAFSSEAAQALSRESTVVYSPISPVVDTFRTRGKFSVPHEVLCVSEAIPAFLLPEPVVAKLSTSPTFSEGEENPATDSPRSICERERASSSASRSALKGQVFDHLKKSKCGSHAGEDDTSSAVTRDDAIKSSAVTDTDDALTAKDPTVRGVVVASLGASMSPGVSNAMLGDAFLSLTGRNDFGDYAAAVTALLQVAELQQFFDTANVTLSEAFRMNPKFFVHVASVMSRQNHVAQTTRQNFDNLLESVRASYPGPHVTLLLWKFQQGLLAYLSTRTGIAGLGSGDPVVLQLLSSAAMQPAPSLRLNAGANAVVASLQAFTDRAGKPVTLRVAPLHSARHCFDATTRLKQLYGSLLRLTHLEEEFTCSCFVFATIRQIKEAIAARLNKSAQRVRRGVTPERSTSTSRTNAPQQASSGLRTFATTSRLTSNAITVVVGERRPLASGRSAPPAPPRTSSEPALSNTSLDDSSMLADLAIREEEEGDDYRTLPGHPSAVSPDTASESESRTPIAHVHPSDPAAPFLAMERNPVEESAVPASHRGHPFTDDSDGLEAVLAGDDEDDVGTEDDNQYSGLPLRYQEPPSIRSSQRSPIRRASSMQPSREVRASSGDGALPLLTIEADQIIVFVENTAQFDPNATLLDALLIHSPSTSSFLRRLLESQALGTGATGGNTSASLGKGLLQRALSFWTTSHNVYFAIAKQAVPSASLAHSGCSCNSSGECAYPSVTLADSRTAAPSTLAMCHPFHYYEKISNRHRGTEVESVLALAHALSPALNAAKKLPNPAQSGSSGVRSVERVVDELAAEGSATMRLNNALTQEVHSNLISFAFPGLGPLLHSKGSKAESSIDENISQVALWCYPLVYPLNLRRRVLDALVSSRRIFVPKSSISGSGSGFPIGADWAAPNAPFALQQSTALSSSSAIVARKLKFHVNRASLLEQGLVVLRCSANCPYPLDIEFDGEAGTGLGPTVEFFTLMAAHLAAVDSRLWLEAPSWQIDAEPSVASNAQVGSTSQANCGRATTALYPSVHMFARDVSHFETLGLLVGRALQDGRTIHLPLHPIFIRKLQCESLTKSLAEASAAMRSVDAVLEQSLEALERMSESELAASDLTFVLPGDEAEELCRNGAQTAVTRTNVSAYCRAVRHHYLDAALHAPVHLFHRGLSRTLVHPRYLKLFSGVELLEMICGRPGKVWASAEDVAAVIATAHGYHPASRVVCSLIDVIAGWGEEHQRLFLKFISGSDCMPLGGLHPKITVVKRDTGPDSTPSRASRLRASAERFHPTPSAALSASQNDSELHTTGNTLATPPRAERLLLASDDSPAHNTIGADRQLENDSIVSQTGGQSATAAQEMQEQLDESLPTVNTCFHYLKLPDYSTREILERRLITAIQEGQERFMLS